VAVVIARTAGPGAAARARADPSLIVPEQAIDAQSLIACADLVVSAGGTMNREAAALGTPVYTIFSGRMGAVDERLIAQGLLRPLSDPAALELTKRTTEPGPRHPRDPELLVEAILGASRVESRGSRVD
jgi:predicted glycosyltransferase